MYQKQLFLSCFLLYLLSNLPLLAQNENSKPINPALLKKHSINAGVINAFGFYHLNYDFRFDEYKALFVSAGYYHYTFSDTEFDGFTGSIGLRNYFQKQQESGFIGLHMIVNQFDIDNGKEYGQMKNIGFIGNIGKRWVLDTGFNITLRAGLGYMVYKRDDLDDNGIDGLDRLLLDSELSIGYLF